MERIGLTDEVLCGLRDRVVPGNSALFVLTTGERPELAGADHELLVHRLTVDQGVALRRHFATDLEPS